MYEIFCLRYYKKDEQSTQCPKMKMSDEKVGFLSFIFILGQCVHSYEVEKYWVELTSKCVKSKYAGLFLSYKFVWRKKNPSEKIAL